MEKSVTFALDKSFVEQYLEKQPPFGFNGLGELVYRRTYSRLKPDGSNEKWYETIERVVNGTYRIQKEWITSRNLVWNEFQAQRSAREMYDRIFWMKFLPPGRGLWAMGTEMTEKRRIFACLQNCAFVSTENLDEEPTKPFLFLMDMSMLGVGVGFDTKGAGKLVISKPDYNGHYTYMIPDSREGWVESLKLLLDSYFTGAPMVEFNYSEIRPAGEPIKGFGGVASGPAALRELHQNIRSLLSRKTGERISSTDIVDIQNFIGKAVVAGNVRRSAEIAIGEADDEAYLDLKDPLKHAEELKSHRWASNNSIFAEVGMDYSKICERTVANGEPGFEWLSNMRNYSRMNDGPDYKDHRAAGCNPCLVGDTLVAVADGRNAVTIKELAQDGADVPIYSISSSGKIETKWGRNPRLTKKKANVCKLTLDDGSILRLTYDHRMILSNGEDRRVNELSVGDSLMRFDSYLDNGYRAVTSFSTQSVRFYNDRQYQRVYSFFNPGYNRKHRHIHHCDFDCLNDRIKNLKIMTTASHKDLHRERMLGERNPVHHLTPEKRKQWIEKLSIINKGENNGMYGKQHTIETKTKIGDKTKLRCTSKSYRKKLASSISRGMQNDEVSKKLGIAAKTRHSEAERIILTADEAELLLESQQWHDLNWIHGKLYFVKRHCLICNKEFVTKIGRRHVPTCGRICGNKQQAKIALETKYNAARSRLSTAYSLIVKYAEQHGCLPKKDEFEQMLVQQTGSGIRMHIGPNTRIGNYADFLNKFALDHGLKISVNPCRLRFQDYSAKLAVEVKHAYKSRKNHKVVSIEPDGYEDVYNLTVDDNHNFGVVTSWKDSRYVETSGLMLGNCSEQSLEDREACTLVETFPHRHSDLEDYKRTLKYSYLYGKTVTLTETHWPETNRVMLRNRRIGCSMSGIAQFITKNDVETLRRWCEEGYKTIQGWDEIYSDWLCIPRSIKVSSIKPSGTVGILAGATPGVHYPESRFCIRRIRIAKDSPLVPALRKAGYHVESAVGQEDSTSVVEFPVDHGEGVRSLQDISMWEQLSLAAFLQKHWADNQVSATISFNPETEGEQVQHALNYFQYQLKGISFLPRIAGGAYPQMPYEAISREKYNELVSHLRPIQFDFNEESVSERFCDNDVCTIS